MRTRSIPAPQLRRLGVSTLRSALATSLVWIGGLKFEDYEVENIHPLVTSSPLFAPLVKKWGEQKLARAIGVAEIAMGSLIAAKPLAPRVSAVGSLGAVGMFVTTLSFLATTPGVWQENQELRSCPWWGSSWPRTACFWEPPCSQPPNPSKLPSADSSTSTGTAEARGTAQRTVALGPRDYRRYPAALRRRCCALKRSTAASSRRPLNPGESDRLVLHGDAVMLTVSPRRHSL
jgi:uncharacterized membrane protein YkgB